MFLPFCPVEVLVASPAAAQAAVRGWLDASQKLLVLASRARCTQLSLTPFFTALQADGHAVQLYTDIPSNPSVEDVAALLARLRGQPFEPSAILAIGGGSCIDLGKAVSALYGLLPNPTPQAVREAVNGKRYTQPHACPELIAMPTTSGTGSEVTRWATLWDPQEKRKLSIDHAQGFPKAAAIVPEWTADMPQTLTLSTGLDALSHAMEAYWSAHRNPLSQELALLAAAKVRDALPAALAEPTNLVARREMALASVIAGLAFSQTRTTACHSISYPLTLLKGIPHGFAVALTLASVMRRNAVAVPEMEKLQAVFCEAEGFDAWLTNVSRGVQPLCLSAFGVTESELPAVVELAFTQGRMDNNPVAFTPADVLEILMENL